MTVNLLRSPSSTSTSFLDLRLQAEQGVADPRPDLDGVENLNWTCSDYPQLCGWPLLPPTMVDVGEMRKTFLVPEIKPLDQYDFFRAKIAGSLSWLLAKSYGS
eukprot:g25618.t1